MKDDIIKAMTIANFQKDYLQTDNFAKLFLLSNESDYNELKSSSTRYIDVSSPIEFMLLDKYYFSDYATKICSNYYGVVNYLDAIALVNLNRIKEAKDVIEEALYWSPIHSNYLSEYFYILHTCNEWDKCEDVLTRMGKYAYTSKAFSKYLRNMGFYMLEYKNDVNSSLGFYVTSLAYEYSENVINEIKVIGLSKLGIDDIFEKYTADDWRKLYEIAKKMYPICPSELVLNEVAVNYNEAVSNDRHEIAKYFLSILFDLKAIDKVQYNELLQKFL